MMDISQIERMLNKFDSAPDSVDDHDLDIDDDDLESELHHIVGSSTARALSPQTVPFATGPSANQSFTNKPTYVPTPFVAPVVPPRRPTPEMHQTLPQVVKPPAPVSQVTTDPKAQKMNQIKQLQVEYKRAALRAKTAGDKDAALAHMKVSKVCYCGL